MLTIGRLASYAGVTIRAVRHYHQIGLLSEPERDASGYRTYDAVAVVMLASEGASAGPSRDPSDASVRAPLSSTPVTVPVNSVSREETRTPCPSMWQRSSHSFLIGVSPSAR